MNKKRYDDYVKRFKTIEKENSHFMCPKLNILKLRVVCPSCGGNLDSEKVYDTRDGFIEDILMALCGKKCRCVVQEYKLRHKQHNIRVLWNRTQIITCSKCSYTKAIQRQYMDCWD